MQEGFASVLTCFTILLGKRITKRSYSKKESERSLGSLHRLRGTKESWPFIVKVPNSLKPQQFWITMLLFSSQCLLRSNSYNGKRLTESWDLVETQQLNCTTSLCSTVPWWIQSCSLIYMLIIAPPWYWSVFHSPVIAGPCSCTGSYSTAYTSNYCQDI